MIKGRKIIWKFYAIMFAMISSANLIWLLHSETEPYVFYHILITWSNFFALHYYLAIIKCLVTIACLYPLFAFAFNKDAEHPVFWQWMLVTRIILEFFGNYYEFVYAKSSYYMVLGYGLSVTGALLLPLMPSYVGHFAYAFPKKN